MRIIDKDITTVDMGIIGHQCNCQGAMGAGVSLAIKNKWPQAYDDYRTAYRNGNLILGHAVYSWINDTPAKPLFVLHLCGQDKYGNKGLYTDYSALYRALCAMKDLQNSHNMVYNRILPLYLPYGIGCGLAGGDWKMVAPMIEKIMPDVTLCKWRG